MEQRTAGIPYGQAVKEGSQAGKKSLQEIAASAGSPVNSGSTDQGGGDAASRYSLTEAAKKIQAELEWAKNLNPNPYKGRGGVASAAPARFRHTSASEAEAAKRHREELAEMGIFVGGED